MDDSLLDDSVFDDAGAGSGSDFDGGAKSKAKAKAKPGPKAGAKKTATAAPKIKAAPKKTAAATKKAAPKKRKKDESDDENDTPNEPSLNDDSILSNTPPSAKKQKKAPAAKKGKPLIEKENDAMNLDGAPDDVVVTGNTKKDNTSRYQKLTQLEHILKRPDTYIGSVERQEQSMWVYNKEKERMELRKVTYNPGLYKIFDEILVNAADNKQNDKNMDTIKVTIDRETGEMSVWNNGRGIPVEIHQKEKMYIPELIFGHLLTSSNYDDDEAKITGGRNGYGAKLCNVYSTKFSIDTADARNKQRYRQTWTDNMSKLQPAQITSNKSDDYTKVTFTPDYPRFSMNGMDDDFEAIATRRVYDLAGTVRGVKVYLNGQRIAVKNFKSYMELYMKAIKDERGEEAAKDNAEIVVEKDGERWEVGFAVSDGSFQQVSFVNSIATTFGGTHVNYVADQMCNKLVDIVKKKNKGGPALKPAQIRNHLFLFVNCQIINPAFTGQTKEQLTTKISAFGSKFVVTDDFMKKIVNKTQVLDNILAFADKKADQILKKSDGSRKSRMDNPKLVDANKAGTKDGHKCTLILIEGDSAKGLAMTGRSIVGPDWFGVFPLRGKLLNVRDASIDQISKNQEIQNIKNILGLKHKAEYSDCKSLRYGQIMIMTDQDHDGSHIKGLLINFFQVQYPSLLKLPNFLVEFITPIVKVYKGDPKKPSRERTFFSMPEYTQWKELNPRWEHKYYKGLGTSSDEDGHKYFKDIDLHLKEFHSMQEGESELIELAFSKKKADDRKEWLRQFVPGTYLDHTTRQISYKDFINKELILFSMADNVRSIPSVIDGFKPGQRKVMFACFKRNLRKDMKVVELAGYVSGSTAYQHGEASLQQTIIGLAQNFVGSNNVNCLEPSGNFGSRLQGGSDAASPRYIYTRLSPFARRVFHPLDDPILKYNTDDDTLIEPEIYVPVVPMVLINGADGIGTGWSTSIPNYSPVDIVDNLKRMIRGEEPEEMTPWFRDWTGKTEKIAPDRYKFSGLVEQDGNDAIVTELPIRLWTDDFKARLVDVLKSEKIPSWIKDYEDYNTKSAINFVIHMEEKHMKKALEEGLEERFKLTKTIATSNLVAFDAEGRLTRYRSAEDMLKEFFVVRLKVYQKRRAYMLDEFNKELRKLTNQARFVAEIIDGKLVVGKKSKKALVAELKSRNYEPFPKKITATKDNLDQPVIANEESEDEETEAKANDYDYLLGMPIWSLTKERYEKLLKQVGDKEAEIDTLLAKTVEDLWLTDLDEFLAEWELQLQEEKNQQKKLRNMGRRASTKLTTQIGTKGRKKRKGDDDSDDDFEMSKNKKKAKDSGPITLAMKKSTITAPAPKPKATQTRLPFGNVKTEPLDLDGTTDEKPPSKAKLSEILSDDEDFDEAAMKPAKAASRSARAGRKAVNYSKLAGSDSDNSDNGDDMLLDVGNMVKGIGGTTAASSGRTLFSTNASNSRPNSSAGVGLKKTTSSGKPKAEEESADETDYHQLIASAKGNKIKPIALGGGGGGGGDDSMMSMDDMDDIMPVPTKKSSAAAASKAPSKLGSKAAAASKPAPLSAAAKAYAAKQAKANTTAAKAKGRKTSAATAAADNESELDKTADALLDDDDEDESILPAPKARGRPGRAAAVNRKKYTVELSDEDSDEFDDGDSD